MASKNLGRTVDIDTHISTVDISSAAVSGTPVNLKSAGSVIFLITKNKEAGTDDPVINIYSATSKAGAGAALLPVVTLWVSKSAVTRTGAETWVEHTQAAGSQVVLTGEAGKQGTYVIELLAPDLPTGSSYVFLQILKAGSTAQLVSVDALLGDLDIQRRPQNLQAFTI